jgi:Protein of unknown function (DUF2630)
MILSMDDKSVLAHISELVDEEHQLRTSLQKGTISESEEHARLRAIEEQLDQLWDLLRRRRAAKEAGTAPDDVENRSIDEVEHYLQ